MPFAELTDVRCYYELLGSGDPVLLIPGLGTTCRLWDEVLPELAASFSLILVDNRGAGQSLAKRQPRALDDLAADLVELLDALKVDKAHVIGLSVGGLIAQRLAIDHPRRVDRLVLISCAHHFAAYLLEMMGLLGHALRYFPRDLFERTIGILGASPEYVDTHPGHIPQQLLTNGKQLVPRSAIATQLKCVSRSDLAAEDFRITAPTLVISGEHDAMIPSGYARQMARDIPGSEFALVPGSGHNPLVEKPETVVPRILEFLERSLQGPDSAKYSTEALTIQ